MIISCAIDQRYAELAGVMIYSIERNGDVEDAEICVVGDGLRQSDKDKIQACAKRSIMFIDLDEAMLQQIKRLPINSNWSRMMYAPLLLPSLIPAEKGPLLYLDADIIIKHSLRHLQDMQMDQSVIAAVGGPSPGQNRRIDRDENVPYFNSGVMLINLQQWKEQELSEKALEILASRAFEYPDQDVLNLLMEGQFICLEEKWNSESGDNHAHIVHFLNAKPNTTYCVHPYKELFLEYRADTPWKNARLKTKLDHRLHRITVSAKRRLAGISKIGRTP